MSPIKDNFTGNDHSMRMKKLKKVRYDTQSGSFIAGTDGFGKNKSVYLDVKDADVFINAVKLAIQRDGENVEVGSRPRSQAV
jgi:hypothetical protein